MPRYTALTISWCLPRCIGRLVNRVNSMKGVVMSDDQKRDEMIKAVTDIEFRPSTEIARQSLSQATKLPFDKLAVAGVAPGSLPEAVRTVTTQLPCGEMLLRATDKLGNPIPSNLLQRFNDGSGMMGSTRIDGEFGQVRLHEVASGAGNAVATCRTIRRCCLQLRRLLE